MFSKSEWNRIWQEKINSRRPRSKTNQKLLHYFAAAIFSTVTFRSKRCLHAVYSVHAQLSKVRPKLSNAACIAQRFKCSRLLRPFLSLPLQSQIIPTLFFFHASKRYVIRAECFHPTVMIVVKTPSERRAVTKNVCSGAMVPWSHMRNVR